MSEKKLFLAILAMDAYNRGYDISFDVAAMSTWGTVCSG